MDWIFVAHCALIIIAALGGYSAGWHERGRRG